jgi:hypothetical protein
MKHFYALLVFVFACSTALAQCNYQLVLQDNFGQGWTTTSGAGVNVTVNGGTSAFYTVQNAGAPPNIVSFPIAITTGDALVFDYTPPAFTGDGQWSLLDSEGIVLFNSGFNPSAAADFSGTALCPSCPAVTALTVSSVDADSAEIGWTNGGTETEWEVDFGISPYTAGSGGTVRPATMNPFGLDGLTSNTSYDVFVRAKCGTDLSSSRGPISFTTTVSCPAPSNIAPITNTSNSISFVWDANGNNNPNVNVQYGVAPFALNGPNGQTVPQNTAPFANVTGLTSDTNYVFFIQIDCGNGDLSPWVGPYTARTLISCFPVTALQAFFVGTTTANITWNPGQSETAWELEHAPVGTITQPGTGQGTLVPLTTPSYTIPSLIQNTAYDVFVRAVCDPALPDFSSRQTIRFTTQCDAFIATTASPYVENFETFTANIDFERENCWSATFVTTSTFSEYDWNVTTTGTTPSAGTGPNTANSGTRYFYTETLGTNGDTATLFSPLINVDGLTSPSVQFFYHLFGVNMGNLSVDVFDGTTWQTGLFTSSGQVQTSGADPFEQAIVDLTGYTGNIQVRFVSTRVGFNTGDMAIDDFSVQEAPACFPVGILSTGIVNATDAEVSWQQQGSETAWLVEYGPAGFTTGTSATDPDVFEVTVTTNPYTIPSLNPNTNYEFYVTAVCGSGVFSAQKGPRSFTTAFLPPQGVPCTGNDNVFVFQEEFENNLNGWTGSLGVGTTTNSLWNFNRATAPGSANTGPNGPFSGGGYAYLETSGNATSPATIVSPPIDLSFANTGAELSFYYFAYGAEIDEFKVNVGLTSNGPWTNEFTAIGQLQTSRTDPWAAVGVNLDAYLGQVIYIQISGKEAAPGSGFAADIAIDLLRVETCGAFCAPPNMITATNITDTTADISFADTNVTPATSFEVLVLPAGSPAPTAATTGVQQTTAASPFNQTGLTPFTDYVIYVRTDCMGASGFSVWSGPVAFQTACATFVAPYFTDFEGFTPTFLFVEENCWSANADGFYDWNVDNLGSTPSAGTGPLGAFSGTTYFYIETNGGVNGNEARLISPLVDITGLTAPSVQFKYHMFGAQTGSLIVDINDGASWINDVFTLTGQQQATQAEDWRDAIVDLSTVTLTSNVIRVRLRSIKAGVTTGDVSIDDFRIDNIPTCPTPSTIVVDPASITLNGATIDWTENGTATLYDVEWGPAGYTQGSPPAAPLGGSAVDVTKPYDVTGLNASTLYDFYVKAKCGPSDESFWAGPVTFQTTCGPILAPHFQDFEGFTATTALVEQACWIASPTTGFSWDVSGTGTTGSTGTGPLAANSGTKFLFTEASTGPAGAVADILSPDIDLSALTAPSLQFHYHMFGAQMGTLEVQIDDNLGGGFVTIQTIGPGSQQPTQATAFYLQVVNLAAYVGQTVQFRFRVTSAGTWEGDVSIDDFRVDELPTCPDPNLLTATNLTDVSAELSWSENGTATVWSLEVQPQGLAQGTPTPVSAISPATNSQIVAGLTADTPYDYYVRSECSPTDQSRWVGPFTFKTECAPLIAPYVEDFELFTANLLFVEQNCWKASTNSTSFNPWDWNLDDAGGTPTTNTGPDAAFNGSRYFYIEGNGGAAGNIATLLSPLVDVTGLTNPSLQFNYHMFGAATGILRVDINDGTGFVNDVIVITGQQQTSGSAPWELAVVDLSGYAPGNIQARFRAERTDTGFSGTSDIALDNVVFDEAPACAQPSILTSANITDSTAELSWNENGSATSWSVEYGPCGFTPGTAAAGAVTITATSNTAFNLTGLASNTCYDFYVTADCGAGTFSGVAGPATFTTACAAFTAPFTDGFENQAVTTTFTDADCWSTPQIGTVFSWDVSAAGTPSGTTTGPIAPANGSRYFFTEATTGSAGAVAELVSPFINLSALTNPALTFNYHMYGADIVGLNVDVNDGTGWTNDVFVLTGQQHPAQTDPWLNAVAGLGAFSGSTVQIRFRVVRGASFNGDIAIDDIVVDDFNGCLTPTNLTLGAVASNSTAVSWTSTGSVTAWEYVNQAAGTGAPTGAGTAATTTSVNITALTPATAYEFYVRSDCGMGNFSSWVGPLSYTTACTTFTLPYGSATTSGNDFTVFPGACWSEGNDSAIASGPDGTDGAWVADDFGNLVGGPNGLSARINVWNNAAMNRDWLVTPEFDLGATGHNFAATYSVALTPFTGSAAATFGSDDSVQMLITTDGGLTWTSIRTFDAATTISPTGQMVNVPLAAYSGTIRLAFWATNGTVPDAVDNNFYVDNFTIDGTAGTDSPEALGFTYYPNPTQDVVSFNALEPISRIAVRNMLGQVIQDTKIDALYTQINLATYAAGMYLIEVKTAGRTNIVRIIKE